MITEVSISQDLIDAAKLFTEQQSQNFYNRNNRRSNDEIMYHVYIGHLGELCFEKISSINNISVKRQENNKEHNYDNGFDFIDENYLKLDIKTLDQSWKRRIYLNDRMMKPDKYVIMLIDKNKNIATYLGSLTIDEVEKYKKYDEKNRCFYVERDKFQVV